MPLLSSVQLAELRDIPTCSEYDQISKRCLVAGKALQKSQNVENI